MRLSSLVALGSFLFSLVGPLPGVGPSAAWAQDGGGGVTLAIVGVHGHEGLSEKDLRKLTDELVSAFEKTGAFDVRARGQLHRGFVAERAAVLHNTFLGRAQEALDTGRTLYEKAQPDLAIEQLSRAVTSIKSNTEFLRDSRVVVDSYMFLGLTLASVGRADDARKAWARVVRIDPDRVLDDAMYSPKIVALFDEVREAVLSHPRGSLTITAPGEADVDVNLDGRFVGTIGEEPVVVSNVVPGKHWLAATAPDLGRAYQTVAVNDNEQLQIEVALQDLGLTQQGKDPLQSERSGLVKRLYREISVAASADLVLMASMDKGQDLQLALYSSRSQAFSTVVRASLNAAPGSRSGFLDDLAGRVALYADERGEIKQERRSEEVVTMFLAQNPWLNTYLFGPREIEDEGGNQRQGPLPFAGIGDGSGQLKLPAFLAIIGGAVAGVGLAVGIGAAAAPHYEPYGVLTVKIP